jgi:hypothetical protein
MPELHFVKSREFLLDEHTYSISIYHSDVGYIAFCDCHVCVNHNMRSEPKGDAEAAAKECEELIEKHHGDCHGPSCPSAA